jgi:hypothetical protein
MRITEEAVDYSVRYKALYENFLTFQSNIRLSLSSSEELLCLQLSTIVGVVLLQHYQVFFKDFDALRSHVSSF